jgi:hypothetical protein
LQQVNHVVEKSPVPSSTLLAEDVPIDWSLKSRLRCVFPVSKVGHQNNLAKQFLATQDSASVTAFVRRIDLVSTSDCLLDNSFETRLRELTYVWQHPHLPWVNSLPRSSSGLGAGDGKSSQVRILTTDMNMLYLICPTDYRYVS